MINGYEIKTVNGEEVLFLNITFDYEFSKLNLKEKKESLKVAIENFIRENKIAFTGTLVSLVIAGNVIGNVNIDNLSTASYVPENLVTIAAVEDVPKYEDIKLEETAEKESVISKNSTKQVAKTPETKSSKTNTTKVIENVTKTSESKPVENPVEQKVEENKTYVTIKRTNGTVITLELEEYLVGVVGAEMPASFDSEALKAQAVIARTYTLKALSKGQTLTDNESTQSYKSTDELKSLWGTSFNTYYSKIQNAVSSTKGMYLTYNGEFIEAVYHSTSNGCTEDAKNVWGNAFPYLVSVDSPYDNINKTFKYDKTYTYEELSILLSDTIDNDTSFEILSKTDGNRVETIKIGNKEYTGIKIRNLLALRSADFSIEKNDETVTFTTKGYGHGVGLSQYGANG